jgi:hypothetical protein
MGVLTMGNGDEVDHLEEHRVTVGRHDIEAEVLPSHWPATTSTTTAVTDRGAGSRR